MQAPDRPVVTKEAMAVTVAAIASAQETDGCIPWFPGHHTDPWNMVEAAMALDAGGRHREAESAYLWLARRQRSDGA